MTTASTATQAAADGSARPLQERYLATRARIASLVGDLPIGAAARTAVPACPQWSVRDLVAHVTGLCADILAGNIAGAATDEWTAAQIDARRDRDTADVLAEWDEVGPPIAAMLDDFPGWWGRQIVADLTIHEHDIRGALGRPARDCVAIEPALDFVLTAAVHPTAAAHGLGPLEVRTPTRTWRLGADGAAVGDPDTAMVEAVEAGRAPAYPTGTAAATVSAEPFELFRAVTGRRSVSQLQRLAWTGDPERYLPLFAAGPFRLREDDLVE